VTPDVKRVVILGGGYAGIKAAEVLAGSDGIEVWLIDKNRYHYLQTESYNLIASNLTLRDITLSLEELAAGLGSGIRFIRDEAVAVEDGAVVGRKGRYPYDYLILATGSVTRLPRVFVSDRLFGVKKLANALHLKHAFEDLLLRHMSGERESSRIVVIGGGSSGVEIAAEMQHYLNRSRLYAGIRVTLVADLFLAELDEKSRHKAREILEASGVEIVEKLVHSVEEDTLVFAEERMPFAFGVVATGIAPESLTRGLELPREGEFLKVDETLRVAERIYAVGDCAALKDRTGKLLPPTAQTAEQSGTQAARNLLRQIRGEPLQPADLKIYGLAIALGGRFAIALTSYGKVEGILAHLGKKMIEKFYKIPLHLKSDRKGDHGR